MWAAFKASLIEIHDIDSLCSPAITIIAVVAWLHHGIQLGSITIRTVMYTDIMIIDHAISRLSRYIHVAILASVRPHSCM